MFTGLVQTVGEVVSFSGGQLSVRFDVSAWPDDPVKTGESVAVNGCCLTKIHAESLDFELSPETTERTAFAKLAAGTKVNLERAMRPMDRLGGHIVQGHVDGVGQIVGILPMGDHTEFVFQIDPASDRYLIDKGSITIDGISLTVVNPEQGRFSVWVIPHTLAHTNLKDAKVGDCVNLEFDVLAKHVEKLLQVSS
ncbi:MAG: riboflavin synthase [Armatimonadetes bacterium]|nr:riboflavin synthase [Armatimonadota bacterium]